MPQHSTPKPRHPAQMLWTRRDWLQRMSLTGLATLTMPYSVSAMASSVTPPVSKLDRQVRIVVAYAAGGASDSIARYVGEAISRRGSTTVIVENKPGADGNIAAEYVARAPTDAYYLLVSGSSTHAANSTIYKKLSYDPLADFTPLANMASTPYAMIVNPKRIAQTNAASFLDWAKEENRPLSFASANVGGRIAGERFKQLTKINAVNVPYKSSSQAMTDLIGGQFDYYFCDMLTALPQINAGNVRALAVSSAQRIPSLPDVPTMVELGYSGFDVSSWIAIWSAKRNTPAPVSAALSAWIGEALAAPEGQKFLTQKGLVPTPVTPDYLTMLQARDTELWGKIIVDAGMQQP